LGVEFPEVKKDRNVSPSPSVSRNVVLYISYFNTTRNHTTSKMAKAVK